MLSQRLFHFHGDHLHSYTAITIAHVSRDENQDETPIRQSDRKFFQRLLIGQKGRIGRVAVGGCAKAPPRLFEENRSIPNRIGFRLTTSIKKALDNTYDGQLSCQLPLPNSKPKPAETKHPSIKQGTMWHVSARLRRIRHGLPILEASRRFMAIYAVGEGWTGALGEKHKLQTIPGHYDEDEMADFQDVAGNLENGGSNGPVMIYAYDDVSHAAVGWGSTAFLDTQGQIHQLGRPQDLMTLFRMNRLPRTIRNWVNQNSDPSETTFVGRMTSKLIGFASGGDEGEIWATAKDLSLLKEWSKLDYTQTDETSSKATRPVGDTFMTKVVCSAGVTLMLGRSGTLYSTGVNNRGQCGIGTLTNNVWAPQRVKGISVSEKKGTERDEQDQPVVDMALGFQHGYALTQSGQLFSWGKGSRGQLGRELDADQDATARRLNLDFNVTQIASGNHHGALLTDDNRVFIWGKNMGRVPADEESSKKSVDAEVPEEVLGLPANKKVLRISCGSHHTSILMDDGSVYGIGIASDEAVPLLAPIEMVPAGIIELPVKQFEAHFDRTTVIDNQEQVLQFHLWKDETLRDHAYFTPFYVDALLDQGQSIEAIHRGWLHTIIVTKQI